MANRNHRGKSSHNQFDREFGEISSRIRRAMLKVVPDDWEVAELVVRETDPESDQFLEIDTPLLNPATDEIIGSLPHEMTEAIEDLYLVFFPYQRPWETCIISLEPTSSGGRCFRTQFFYAEKP